MSTYVERLNGWRVWGYRAGYSTVAQAFGHLGIGLLAPFKLAFDKIKQSKDGWREHIKAKETNSLYRAAYRYTKTLHRVNQEFLMRPTANLAGILGGLVSTVLGVLFSVIPIDPPERKPVTLNNEYFSEIKISKKTQKLFGVIIWAGIAGAIFGAFYPAPLVLAGNFTLLGKAYSFNYAFQGSQAFAELFSMSAGFVYELPTVLKETWHFTKNMASKLKNTIIWIANKLENTLEFIFTNTWHYGKKLVIALKDGVVWGLTKLKNMVVALGQGIESVLKNVWHYSKQLAIALKDGVVWGLTKLNNICVAGWAHLVSFKNWAATQFNYVYDKIAKVVNIIRENGIRGLLAWVKDKTIGSALRYLDNLNQIGRVQSDMRELVDNLLDNEGKRKLLLTILDTRIDWLTLDLSKMPKLDQINLIMSHINKIAEAHRTNYQNGNVEVKLVYLENLKNMLKKLASKSVIEGKKDTLMTELGKVLYADYRSWDANADKPKPDNAGTKDPLDLEKPNQVMFNQYGSDVKHNDKASNDEEGPEVSDKKKYGKSKK